MCFRIYFRYIYLNKEQDCCICLDSFASIACFDCKHKLCSECDFQYASFDNHKCPLCKAYRIKLQLRLKTK